MAEDSDKNRENRLLREAKERRQDAADFGNETAGREIGRQTRFLSEGADQEAQKAEHKKHTEELSRLAILMQDKEYAALYRGTVDLAREYAAKAEAGVVASKAALSMAGQELETLTGNAARLHTDGSLVFLDKNGQAIRADGTVLTQEEAASIVWPDDAPSYEEYLAAKKAYADAQAQFEAWRDYQQHVGGVQNRLDDPNNPYSPDELKDTQQEIRERIPAANSADSKISVQPDQPVFTGSSDIEKPAV